MKRPKILFLCVANMARSQMAEGFARHYGGDRVEVRSGGTHPGRHISRSAVEVMAEKGIDLLGQAPKGIDLEFAEQADRIITMGCSVEEACPARLLPKVEDWALPDPAGGSLDEYRRIRDDVEQRVLRLLRELGLGTRSQRSALASRPIPKL